MFGQKLILSSLCFVLIINYLAGFNVFAQNQEGYSDYIKVSDVPSSQITKFINVPYLDQNDVVSGCEAISATMLLQKLGYQISGKSFTDDFLIKKDWSQKDGVFFGPDPNSAYPGNPYIASGENCGFGCYSNALAKSINNFFEQNNIVSQQAISINRKSINYLINNYVSKNIPVLIWATMDMKPSKLTMSWLVDYADEDSQYNIGDEYTWRAGEHCLVLIGYDYYNYYFNDPYKSHGIIGYDKKVVEKRYRELGNMAVVILEK